MPQEHHVLRCFSCETFQVHIVKKTNKWECKICGTKQSLKRNYGKGSGKDCRAQVMKLNELRLSEADVTGQEPNESFDETLISELKDEKPSEKKPAVSKWAEYLDEKEPDQESEGDDDYIVNVVNEKKRKRVSKENNTINSKKMCNEITDEIPCETTEIFHTVKTSNEAENFKSIKSNKNIQSNNSLVHSNKTGLVKQSKYSKFLDEDESESNDNLLDDVNKSSNLFDLDPIDLDDLLNF